MRNNGMTGNPCQRILSPSQFRNKRVRNRRAAILGINVLENKRTPVVRKPYGRDYRDNEGIKASKARYKERMKAEARARLEAIAKSIREEA